MTGRTFLDTNVPVYLFDADQPAKQRRLLSEDLQHGRAVGGLTIQNPFRT